MALPRVAAAAAAPFTAAGRVAGSAASNTARAALAAAAGPELLAIKTSLTSTVQGIVRSVRGEYSRLAAANDASSESLDDIKENTSGFSTSIDSLIDVVRNEVVPPLNTMGGYFQDLAEKLSRQRALAGLTDTTPTSSDDTPGITDAQPGNTFGKKLFGFLGGIADGLWGLFKKFWLPLGLAGLLLLAKNAFLEGNSEFARRIKNAIDFGILGGIGGFLVGGIPGMIVGGILGAALGAILDPETVERFTSLEGITLEIANIFGVTTDTLKNLATSATVGALAGSLAGFFVGGVPGAIVGLILGAGLGAIIGTQFLPDSADKEKIDLMISNMLGFTVEEMKKRFKNAAEGAGIGAVFGGAAGFLVGGPVGVIAGGIIGAGLGAVIGYKWEGWFPEKDSNFFNWDLMKNALLGSLVGAAGWAAMGAAIGSVATPVGMIAGALIGAAVFYAVEWTNQQVEKSFGSWSQMGKVVMEKIQSIFESINNAMLRFVEDQKARFFYFFQGRDGALEDIEESKLATTNLETTRDALLKELQTRMADAEESGVDFDPGSIENLILGNQINTVDAMLNAERIKREAIENLIQERSQDLQKMNDEISGRGNILMQQLDDLNFQAYGDPNFKRTISYRPNLRTNPGAIGYGNGGQPIIMINNNQSYPQVYQNNSKQSVVNQSSSTFIRRSGVPVAQMI